MKILVIGGGGREHAICVALSKDESVTALHCAPGNPGTAQVAQPHQVDALDPGAVTALAVELGVDLVVVGPEAPLVAGVADAVRAAGIACFGPSKAAAQLEGSKAFSKDVMAAAGVPTAESFVCTTLDEAEHALDAFGPTYVVKDDALAAGKGVVVTDDRDAALAHVRECVSRPGGGRVVIEAFLDGPEVSLFAITDGRTVLPLQPAQDFKRIGDGDSGPNTGGMGAYSPLDWAPAGLVDEVMERVLQPTVDELRRRGTPFAGLLYAGLALTGRGTRVIEFNARFGDPEAQVVLPLLKTPLAGVLLRAATGTLADQEPLSWSEGAAVTVVLASDGYPAKSRSGDVIRGVRAAEMLSAPTGGSVTVYQAGTAHNAEDELVTAGGRVLAVTGHARDLARARKLAYAGVTEIAFDGAQHRTDIAAAALAGGVRAADA
ncbi:phosphoribosylamine--glycine ligase [Actinospica sp.]|uniref:phosphoribosylamine--glycine ligase n=1 Tax=Actinospica sp. TaxID=1872142 RepID=UPI002B84E309|nr:phosphoribosylamine--glycine ligase [Actinospica sp.]HWG22722.1 phosphoribosylamine--glycine ligase [Actinospica sp.]